MVLLWWKRTTLILDAPSTSGFHDMLVASPPPFTASDVIHKMRSERYKTMGFDERYTILQELVMTVVEPNMSHEQAVKAKSVLTESLMGLADHAPHAI